ncbi:putative phage abortive infection protein [Lysinibacillus sp. NPDC093692]|uniref:putative phage abortive infection protein n=1 Tax=Lysinibacillus sp. NPDC093692 TaxID=3390578 RepID=UPI003CFBD311
MSSEKKPYKEWIKENENKWIFGGIITICFAILAPILIFFLSKSSFTFDSFANLGTVGDFLGGSTVGLLSLASILFLISTIVMQRKELGLQREELRMTREELAKANEQYRITNETMKLQQFETTFFNMISMHSNLINDLKALESSGRNVIVQFLKEVNKGFETEGFHSFLLDHFRKFDDIKEWYNYYSTYINYINNLNHYSGVKLQEMQGLSRISDLKNKLDEGRYLNSYNVPYIEQIYLLTFDEIKKYNKKDTAHEFSRLFRDELLNGANSYKKKSFVNVNEILNFPLSNYIKSVRTIIRFLDDTDFENTTKNKYLNIFFSQFTIHEITVIKYFIELGQEDELKRYFNRYSSLNTKEVLKDSLI